MKVVYIAAPFKASTREEMDKNRARAARWVAWAAYLGVAPVATWIVLTGEFEENPKNRELGLAIDCATVERCDELWFVVKVTDGMRRESGHAKKVVDLTGFGEEPPEGDFRYLAT